MMLIISFQAISLFSQQKNLYFNLYSTQDGLSQNTITGMVQDKNGFIWLATENGLNRFDGYSFKNWYESPENKNSLTSAFINALAIDKRNRIWIASSGGIDCFDPTFEQFHSIPFNINNKRADFENSANCLLIDSENYLWVGAKDGLCRSVSPIADLEFNDPDSVKFQRILKKLTSSLDETDIKCLIEYKRNIIWTGSKNGLIKYNKTTKKSERFYFDKMAAGDIAANSILSLLQVNDSILWIGTEFGLFGLNTNSNKSFSFTKHPFFMLKKISGGIKSLLRDKSGNIWIGTLGSGILCFDSKENKFLQYLKGDKKKHGLEDNYNYSLFEDQSGTLFVGSFSNGLQTAKISGSFFESFGTMNNDDPESSNNYIIKPYCQDTNTVWISTLAEGLKKFNPKSKRYVRINNNPFRKNGKLQGIRFVVPEKNNKLWIGTKNKGLILYNLKTNTFEEVLSSNNGVLLDNIYCFHSFPDSIIYFGTLNAELLKLNRITKESTINTLIDSDSNKLDYGITFLNSNKKDILWIATWGGGLLKLNLNTGITEQIIHSKQKRNSISSDFLLGIHIDQEGILWIGTTAGLNKYNPKTAEFTLFGKKNGFNDEFINSIEEDDHENLWISTNNGLVKFDKNNETVTNFDEKDGLQNKEFNSWCNTKLPDGKMIFGGINGFNLFHPDSIKPSIFRPNISITELQLFYSEVTIGMTYDHNFLLNKSIAETDTIILNYKNNVIGFKFTAFDYTKPNNIKYAFRLKGFEENWNYTDKNERLARYTNLRYGSYVLQIKSTNGDGVWNPHIKELTIIIKAPFWLTNEFRISFVLFILLILFWIYRIRTKLLKRQKIKLEKIVEKRTQEVTQKNFELKDRYEEIVVQEEEIREQAEELRVISAQLEKTNKSLSLKVKERTYELEGALNKAEDAQKLISSFLSNLSHEIRTPMNAIMGFTQLIGTSDLTEPKKYEYTTIIENNVHSLLTQIDNIMDVARLHTGQYVFKNLIFSLSDLFSEIYSEMKDRRELINKNLSLNIEIIEEMKFNSDRNVFKNILINLVDNAIKYTDKGFVEFGFRFIPIKQDKKFTYELNKNSTVQLELFVNDSGIGIDKKEHEIIFDAFRKIEDNKQKLYRGTGLGLSLVKNLTKQLNGYIAIDSKVNSGTKISIKIPVSGI